MISSFFSAFETVPLQRIDPTDRTFAVSVEWSPLDELLEGMRRFGILTPLLLQSREGGTYRVVRGFRRLAAARKLGLEAVPAWTVGEKDPLLLFLEALAENLGSRELSELEKGRAVWKLRRQFHLDEATLMKEVLPLLKVRPDRYHLVRYVKLGGLPERLQRAVADQLDPDLALRLVRWAEADQEFFLALLDRYRPGRNRQKQLFQLFDELAQGKGLESIWNQSGAAATDADEKIPSAQRLDGILARLQALRFPTVTEYQQRLQDLKSSLGLPPGIRLTVPAFLEGDRVEIQLQAHSPQELRGQLEKLAEISQRPELKEIFELL